VAAARLRGAEQAARAIDEPGCPECGLRIPAQPKRMGACSRGLQCLIEKQCLWLPRRLVAAERSPLDPAQGGDRVRGKAQPGISGGPVRVLASLAGKPSRMYRSPNRSRCLTQAPARTTDSAPTTLPSHTIAPRSTMLPRPMWQPWCFTLLVSTGHEASAPRWPTGATAAVSLASAPGAGWRWTLGEPDRPKTADPGTDRAAPFTGHPPGPPAGRELRRTTGWPGPVGHAPPSHQSAAGLLPVFLPGQVPPSAIVSALTQPKITPSRLGHGRSQP
jgi:hypothetical protein